jgi:hypothetical protein
MSIWFAIQMHVLAGALWYACFEAKEHQAMARESPPTNAPGGPRAVFALAALMIIVTWPMFAWIEIRSRVIDIKVWWYMRRVRRSHRRLAIKYGIDFKERG